MFKGSFKKINHPIVLPVLLFILGHCFIGHKEERFVFPILHVLPIIIGWVLNDFFVYYKQSPAWVRYSLAGIIGLSAILNFFLLLFFNA